MGNRRPDRAIVGLFGGNLFEIPQMLYGMESYLAATALHPEACLECGLCAFVCPARRPLAQLVKLARTGRRRTS